LVAVLIFLWSWLMPTRDYILMFFALSGAIWNAGAGACIIGGLYWRRGNATGAAAALVTGATTSLLALCAQIWLGTERFTLNGQEILTTGSVLSTFAYVSCSLLSGLEPRGAAIVDGLAAAAAAAAESGEGSRGGKREAAGFELLTSHGAAAVSGGGKGKESSAGEESDSEETTERQSMLAQEQQQVSPPPPPHAGADQGAGAAVRVSAQAGWRVRTRALGLRLVGFTGGSDGDGDGGGVSSQLSLAGFSRSDRALVLCTLLIGAYARLRFLDAAGLECFPH
jgi:hypothetical protein